MFRQKAFKSSIPVAKDPAAALSETQERFDALIAEQLHRVDQLRDPFLYPGQSQVIQTLLTVAESLRDMRVAVSNEGRIADIERQIQLLAQTKNELPAEAWYERSILALGESWLLHAAIPHTQARVGAPASAVVVPTDILYQSHQCLFPPERMLVISGRREGTQTVLSAVFDVTGEANHGHVRADPANIGRALIAMDKAGNHLAGWVHSHPGQGARATFPSETDRRQYKDWLRDFSPSLLAAIIVEDGYIRFWGNVGNSSVALRIIGSGIERVEDDDGHTYRLN